MNSQPIIHLDLEIFVADSSSEELDMFTRLLLSEVRELNVESVVLSHDQPAPNGTKSADPVTLGALAIAVLPAFLPKLLEFLQAWSARGRGRAVKFKGKINGADIEFEGAAEDLQNLIAGLSKPKAG